MKRKKQKKKRKKKKRKERGGGKGDEVRNKYLFLFNPLLKLTSEFDNIQAIIPSRIVGECAPNMDVFFQEGIDCIVFCCVCFYPTLGLLWFSSSSWHYAN
jgi:hypothetical protein